MLRKYGDNIELVIAAFGPGLHLLAKRPKRPVSAIHQQRVQSLIEYGVRFQACGNTMKSMHWTEKDIILHFEAVMRQQFDSPEVGLTLLVNHCHKKNDSSLFIPLNKVRHKKYANFQTYKKIQKRK